MAFIFQLIHEIPKPPVQLPDFNKISEALNLIDRWSVCVQTLGKELKEFEEVEVGKDKALNKEFRALCTKAITTFNEVSKYPFDSFKLADLTDDFIAKGGKFSEQSIQLVIKVKKIALKVFEEFSDIDTLEKACEKAIDIFTEHLFRKFRAVRDDLGHMLEAISDGKKIEKAKFLQLKAELDALLLLSYRNCFVDNCERFHVKAGLVEILRHCRDRCAEIVQHLGIEKLD